MDERTDDRGGIALPEQTVALGVETPGRSGIEHDGSGERRLLPQDESVPARRDDRGSEPELSMVVPHAHDTSRESRRTVMDGQPGAVQHRLQLRERDFEPIGARKGPGRDERLPATDVRALDPRKVDSDPLPCLGPGDRGVVDLHRADADVTPGRLEPQLVALADRARPERPRDDRADPAQREHTIDVEPRREVRAPLMRLGGNRLERIAKLGDPGPGDPAHRDDRRSRNELARLVDGELERLRVDRVGLGHGDHALLDAEEAENRKVLVGLCASSLGRVDHEQEEVDPGRPGHHRAHEALVSRDVDERERPPARKLERRVAEVDRDPAGPLLGEPVRVLARERADERRLAMIDVTRRADGEGH